MITIVADISTELTQMIQQLEQATNSQEVTRVVASGLVPVVRDRIHVQGRAADDSQIGTYSKGYMAVRTGQFKTNGTYKSGKRKGETKDTGEFTRGARKGQPRPNYNRTSDTKVVASLTRQMENDLSVQAGSDGYGIGFSNPENAKKAEYVEKTYGKVIYGLTQEEQQLAVDIAVAHVTENLP